MLKILRKKGVAKKLLWATAIVIIISFGLFGEAYLMNSGRKGNIAGTVFGKKVSVDDIQRLLALDSGDMTDSQNRYRSYV